MKGRAVLAPMAGIADGAFRFVAKSFGAALVFTELASADGLLRGGEKTFRLIAFFPEERPIGIQIFGSEPDTMAEAARIAAKLRPDLIDLNFGCPAKKVVRRAAGAAVLKDLKTLETIVRAVAGAVPVPLSIKIRSGWDASQVNAVDAARAAEAAGAHLVTVHARTQKQGFSGRADWDVIRRVKEAVSIPVIGNGDVQTAPDALRMRDETGCDLVMIGRGALGRPWIFRQINRTWNGGVPPEEPSAAERIRICLDHYRRAVLFSGEPRGVLEMRKHIAWYVKGMQNNATLRQEVFRLTDPKAVEERLLRFARNFS